MTADANGLTEFYDFTRRLLLDARMKRSEPILRRCVLRLDSDRFNALSRERRAELRGMYDEAATACGMGAA